MGLQSSSYNAVTHPVDLPARPFYVHGADALTRLLVSTIEKMRPGAAFAGLLETDLRPSVDDAVVLITDADWEMRARQLAAAGWTGDLIFVMPFPADCPNNGFAKFVSELSGMFGVDRGDDLSAEITLPNDLAVSMLLRDGRAKVDSTGIGIVPNLFPRMHEPNRLKASAGEIQAVAEALCDEKSRRAYDSVLRDTPVSKVGSFVSTMMRGQQYFEYARVKPGDTVLNYGVFDGFELPLFAAQMHGQGRLVNIDPLGHSYLSRYVRDAIAQYEDLIEIQPYCITDQDGRSEFIEYVDGQAASHAHAMNTAAKAGSGTALATYPTRKVATLIDEIAPDRIDLMKFDVEGAEEMIIPQLGEVIARYRPQIAMSVYHATRHLWEMPLALMEMCDGYDFYFGSYSMTRYESIFYCLPRT